MASDGDIRVLLVLDLLLSLAFSAVALWGLDFFGIADFTVRTVGLATVIVAALTYVVVLQ